MAVGPVLSRVPQLLSTRSGPRTVDRPRSCQVIRCRHTGFATGAQGQSKSIQMSSLVHAANVWCGIQVFHISSQGVKRQDSTN